MNVQLQAKTDFSDLEAVAHKLHAKADFEKVQDLLSQLKAEVVSQLTGVKKEVKKKTIKKKTDIENSVREQELANEKMFEEIRGFKEKLTKLANQFDKELVERDKALKQYQTGLWDDIQSMLSSIQEDTQSTNKLCQTLANLKADKKELNEVWAKLTSSIQQMVTSAEFTANISNFNSDVT